MRYILIGIVILLTLVVVLPFVLNVAGFQVLQFAAVGGVLGSNGTILGTRDAGVSWDEIKVSLKTQPFLRPQITDIEFHPIKSDVMFVAAGPAGLWRSNDLGKTWEEIPGAAEIMESGSGVYEVALNSKNPELIYIGVSGNGRGSIFKSNGEGKISFEEVYLFYGPEQIGKFTTAKVLAKAFWCKEVKRNMENICNECSDCCLIEEDTHPHVLVLDLDHTLISKKEIRKDIPIEDIRELKRRFSYAPLPRQVYRSNQSNLLRHQRF